MRLANQHDELARLGAEVAGLVVDPPERNAAFALRWRLPFPIHADLGGEQFCRPLGLWNEAERGGIAKPAVLLVAPDGEVSWRFDSRDFADRPPDDADLLDAVRALGLAPVQPTAWHPAADPVEDPGAFRVDLFGPYFRAIRFASMALSNRMQDPADQAEARRMSAMAASFLDAWAQRREADG